MSSPRGRRLLASLRLVPGPGPSYNSFVRKSIVSLFLSLSILALATGAGLWLLHRGDREQPGGDRSARAGGPLDGPVSPAEGLGAGSAPGERQQGG